MNLKEELLEGTKRIAVWGTGFIGYSTMAYFGVAGVKSIGYDIDGKIVESINRGEIPVIGLEHWLGFDVKPLVAAGIMKATNNSKDLFAPDVAVHFLAIPTEKGAEPWDGALRDVIGKLLEYKKLKPKEPPLVIVESTLTPGLSDKLVIPMFEEAGLKVGKDILYGVAPRRDWFISSDKSLKTLPRIAGGSNPETTKIMESVLNIVTDRIVPAPDHRHAEIVKSIENAYRHMDITLANQLTKAFPNLNMREILRMVGTKWNIGTYHPSFCTGGYCIPLSSQYVLWGAERPEELTLLKDTLATDMGMAYDVADSLVRRGAKKVGILGLAYKGDLKVHVLSPTLKIAKRLIEKGISVKVNDPYYNKEEIKKHTGVETFDFPNGLSEFDTILLVADHRLYKFTQRSEILKHLKNCKLILDNTGLWKDINFGKIEYHLAGDKGWLG